MVRREDRAFQSPRRFIAMGLSVLLVFTALTARLWDLQVINGAHYRSLSEENRVLRLPVDAERGMITDRNGYVLARNLPGFAVMVLPVDLPRGKQDALVAQLAPSSDATRRRWRRSSTSSASGTRTSR
jgi:penicillin-binding protein 2